MIPWSVTMRPTLTLICVLAMGLFACVGAITVSIERSDNKPPPTRSSMIANGWRPLTNGYEEPSIGTNVSPSSSLEQRNGPILHPVHSKLQEHMASEKLKPQRKGKPSSHHEYSPPAILGSFTMLSHAAAKARGEAQNHGNKHSPSETREYTFLIPPPKDAYRFDLDQHRKPILRDNGGYLRQPQFPPMHQAPDPIKAATYFINGYTSTTNPPSSQSTSKNRHFAEPYVPQLLQPPRYQVKPFESLKVSNSKPYYQPPLGNDFGKDKRLTDYDHRQNYEKYPGQHNDHVLNQASSGNFFGQASHQFKTTYERDPAFLVHESHEIGYITPPSVYNPFNFRPSLPYETLLPPDVYTSSTPAPTTPRSQEQNKYQSGETVHDYRRPNQANSAKQVETMSTPVSNTYYVSEHQDLTPPPSAWPITKNKYPSDINEVLPRVNPPSKFNQEPVVSNQIVSQVPKVVFVGPQAQAPQFPSSILPIDVGPEETDAEYETPESISLKHFNEQQYLIQQQLLQKDRQRLAEHERQQQLEIEKRQQEELRKRQEELDKRQEELSKLLERQKSEEEEDRLAVESAKNQSEQLAKVTDEQSFVGVQLASYEPPKVTAVITEQTGFGEQPMVQQPQITEYAISTIPAIHSQDHSKNQQEQVNYREQPGDLRPPRPYKPGRDQYRRRKPSTSGYEPTPTEAPVHLAETSLPVTLHAEEVPLQTTTPETATLATISTQKARTRRPGASLRRRRPTTTTPEPESATVGGVDDFLKYGKPEEQVDAPKRRRIKPTQTYDEVVTEKKANIRKRPGHRNRVNPGEPFEAEIVTEIVHAPTYRTPTESIQYNNEYQQLVTNQPNQFDYNSEKTGNEEESTQAVPVEYYTEFTRTRPSEQPNSENYDTQGPVVTNIPLEDLFAKTDGNYLDRTSSTSTEADTPSPVTTVATTTQSSTRATVSSTSRPQNVRPMRYGNATRPRFSIKDYRTPRPDYKARLSQISTTESSAPATKHRGGTKGQRLQNGDGGGARETTGRYKYIPKVNYRTSTASPLTPKEQEPEDGYSTTERSRFVPKRRPINRNLYRSSISATTGSPSRSQGNYDGEKPSTARPENVFSSSVRRRPVMKSRLPAQSSTAVYPERKETEATEMAAEETSFYSSVTTTGTTKVVANEIPVEREEASTSSGPVNTDESENGTSFHGETGKQPVVDSSTEADNDGESQLPREGITEQYSAANTEETTLRDEKQETGTTFEIRSEDEELFAKASQSVADLTSSASALYDKPGMFKAVSPETRVVATHFKIPTDEPTLPIEAFFQELSKKS